MIYFMHCKKLCKCYNVSSFSTTIKKKKKINKKKERERRKEGREKGREEGGEREGGRRRKEGRKLDFNLTTQKLIETTKSWLKRRN
jgi:hypothetical protein